MEVGEVPVANTPIVWSKDWKVSDLCQREDIGSIESSVGHLARWPPLVPSGRCCRDRRRWRVEVVAWSCTEPLALWVAKELLTCRIACYHQVQPETNSKSLVITINDGKWVFIT